MRRLAEMERRAREDDYAPDPEPDAWRDSIAPGVRRTPPPTSDASTSSHEPETDDDD